MFHLLTVFLSNSPEQERYYITNMLKKPQRVSVHQFVHCVEQLNSYIAQLKCFYYSPSVNPTTTPAHVPFTEADLVSHVLRMCPLQWQDQFNLHEKGMTPIDMCLLIPLLRILSVYVRRRSPKHNPARKLPTRARRGTSNLVLSLRPESQRKLAQRSIVPYARSMGAFILCTIRETVISIRKTERRNPIPRRQERQKKTNPTRQKIAQLSKKLDKLEKALKKSSFKSKKHCYKDSDSNSE
jgi:hypothetical protein